MGLLAHIFPGRDEISKNLILITNQNSLLINSLGVTKEFMKQVSAKKRRSGGGNFEVRED
jgi:hypothetical protein